jgi:hypothetical protein
MTHWVALYMIRVTSASIAALDLLKEGGYFSNV